jgi:hypothetical protein
VLQHLDRLPHMRQRQRRVWHTPIAARARTSELSYDRDRCLQHTQRHARRPTRD